MNLPCLKFNFSREHKKVINNFFYLSILQIVNYILPLFLISFLIRQLGVDKFGILAFSTATIALFRGVVAYSFDMTATKSIAINRSQKNISKVFFTVMATKLILTIVSFIFLSILSLLLEPLNDNFLILSLTFLIVLGDALFPTWLFQGIEKMELITGLRIIYKISVFLFTIMLINSPDDYFLVPLIDGVGAIFVGIVSIYIARNKNDFLKYVPTMFDIKEQVVNGKDIFFSQIVVYFYTSFNVFLLGLLLSPNIVGYYTLAEKIYSAIRGVLKPLNQAVFPYLSRVYGNDFSIFCHSAKVLTLVYLLFLSFACSVCYFFSNEIIELVSGNRIEKAGFILEVFALALLFGIGSLYTSLLVIKSQSKYLFKITLLTTTFNLVFVYPVTINFGIVGMAYLYLSTQVFQFLLQIYHNRDIWIYKV